ncbi:uncharacterized protein IL334_005113 [Kwoniella shivajii]|uniref:Heme oxygenase-like, multi-helical n=1 Tax=Kwoniella shivajii TaxID=564305 RepID=A0ABZ1D293_9TREE|nr:hypothetical protein IL334_005113 [Kwoniella shivajii]
MNASRTVVSSSIVDRTLPSRPRLNLIPLLENDGQIYSQAAWLLLSIAAFALTVRALKAPHRQRPQTQPYPPKSYNNTSASIDPSSTKDNAEQPVKPYLAAFPDLSGLADLATQTERERMVRDKKLYWKMQNLEDHRADVIPEARQRLIGLFDQTMSEALSNPYDTIVSLSTYDSTSLRAFLQTSHRSATSRYEAYLERRKAGGPREMFPTTEFALEWLRLAGVVKYVDGGWLGGILGIGTGRASCLPQTKGQSTGGQLERSISKMAWQVISEEFGDGDLEKNHIYLYEKLLNKISAGKLTPDDQTSSGYVRGFDGLEDNQGVPRCWEAAIAQQCIGLLASSQDFFPEALGFNMAYESLPYHLLITARELKELDIDNYYFAIHVTIDNADSGHSAMARIAVERYLEGVRERDGDQAMHNIWRRIQVGYILAEGLPTTPSGPIEFEPVRKSDSIIHWQPRSSQTPPVTPAESKLVNVIVKKAGAAEKMHCTSKMRIGGETVEQWLDPRTISETRALSFIRALATKRPFVVPGDTSRSRFVQDLEWGGKMFGAFTGMESDIVKNWIRSLQPRITSEGTYERFVGRSAAAQKGFNPPATPFEERTRDLWTIHDVNPMSTTQLSERVSSEDLITQPMFETDEIALEYSRLRSIWYVSTSLFECFPLQPSRFATPLGMFSLRLLRSQLGFGALHLPEDICAGTDDLDLTRQEGDMIGLWELGEKLDQVCNIPNADDIQQIARDTTDRRTNEFCAKLLDLRSRPYTNSSYIFGVSLALCKGVHGSRVINNMLGEERDQGSLSRIVDEQLAIISELVKDYIDENDQQNQKDFVQGFLWARNELSIISI